MIDSQFMDSFIQKIQFFREKKIECISFLKQKVDEIFSTKLSDSFKKIKWNQCVVQVLNTLAELAFGNRILEDEVVHMTKELIMPI